MKKYRLSLSGIRAVARMMPCDTCRSMEHDVGMATVVKTFQKKHDELGAHFRLMHNDVEGDILRNLIVNEETGD